MMGRNNKYYCKICGTRILNKQKHSIYCIECGNAKRILTARIGGFIFSFTKSFPKYKVQIKYKMIKSK